MKSGLGSLTKFVAYKLNNNFYYRAIDWFSMVREINITKHVNLLLPLKDLE
jgi:hypothetical protein